MANNVDYSVIIAVLTVISGFYLGVVGNRRAKTADKATEKASAVDQIITGLNSLVDQLQEENKDNRDVIKELRDALQKVTQERNKFQRDLRALQKQFGTSN